MEYIVTVQDSSVIERMREHRLNIYVPALRRDFVVIVTDLSKDELMAFDGVLDCRESRTFRLSAEGGMT